MKNLEYKSFQTTFAADDEGIIEAFVSIYGNVDAALEVVDYGAYSDSLTKKLPKILFQHDWNKGIGITLDAQELAPGDDRLPDHLKEFGALWVKGQLNLDTQIGRETWSNAKMGVYDEFSVGYKVEEDYAGKDGYRHLKKMRLFEWSFVLVGANDRTELIGLKSDSPEIVIEIEETKPESKNMDELLAALKSYLESAMATMSEIEALQPDDVEEASKSEKILDTVAMIELINQAIAKIDELLAAGDPAITEPVEEASAKIGRTISRNNTKSLVDVRAILDELLNMVSAEAEAPVEEASQDDQETSDSKITLEEQIQLEKMLADVMVKSFGL